MENIIMEELRDYPAVLDVEDVKNIMRVGRDSAYKMMHSGEFRVIRVGRQLRVTKTVFANYLAKSNHIEEVEGA